MKTFLRNVYKKENNIDTKTNFSLKGLLSLGLIYGGHISLANITTLSSVYGLRTRNLIININKTALELTKLLTIITGIGYERGIIYFINSILSFSIPFLNSFNKYNRHLFFPTHFSLKIEHAFKRFSFLKLSKKTRYKIRLYKMLNRRKRFLLRSGKALLRKFFISSKWSYGFVSNAKTFFSFTDNVQHEKVRFGRVINTFEEKVRSLFDFYPFLPNYGLIGDHKSNYWIVNEFKMARVPNSSVIDNFTKNALKSMYSIPANACSLDTTVFFLMLAIASYLLGYTKKILKFLSFNKINELLGLNEEKIITPFFFKTYKLVFLLTNRLYIL
jgi:hypothetical protein